MEDRLGFRDVANGTGLQEVGGGGTGSRWLQSVKLRKSRKCWHHQQRWVSRDVFSFVWFFGKALCACGETFKMHL